jgi:iron(II)-dependent oxidoreductase
MNVGSIGPAELEALLTEARNRTLALIEPLSDEDLTIQHSPLMSPIVWDLGHIANFEDLWLHRVLADPATLQQAVEQGGEGLNPTYDAMKVPRSERMKLDLPDRSTVLDYLSDVREQVLAVIADLDPDPSVALLRDSYVFRMVLQHEYQHDETIIATLQLKQGEPYHPGERREMPPAGDGVPRGTDAGLGDRSTMVFVEGGPFTLGTDDAPGAYDNESPAHTVDTEPFLIDICPVSNAAFMAFVREGGYDREEFWSPEGWAHRTEAGLTAPGHWEQRGEEEWFTRSMDHSSPVDPDRPVTHITWYEADAFARFAGKRLPSETEWEKAASWDAERGVKLAWPWGDEPWSPERANLDQHGWGAAPLGAYPGGASPCGCHQMIGDVWEWTRSDFHGYPGFRAWPYREYSEVHFGPEYKVLRGGSWATRPGAVRNTFRNWDFPIRRQIFTGMRCVLDV